ncbi:MAG: LytR C-terminal domain-containing protein [Actinomycetota bacterium]|nr:LytR C-terminal domain-containing protein [Actinomycetota bacterium]
MAGRDAHRPTGSEGRTAARGAALVAAALVVGLILYARLPSLGSHPATTAATRTAVTATTVPARHPVSTTTTVAVVPGNVQVLVANGTAVSGAAGRLSTKLGGAGYNVLAPVTATRRVSQSSVYYSSGNKAAAVAVASALGLASSAVASMPANPPVTDTLHAMVLVVMGPKLASSYGPTPAGVQG